MPTSARAWSPTGGPGRRGAPASSSRSPANVDRAVDRAGRRAGSTSTVLATPAAAAADGRARSASPAGVQRRSQATSSNAPGHAAVGQHRVVDRAARTDRPRRCIAVDRQRRLARERGGRRRADPSPGTTARRSARSPVAGERREHRVADPDADPASRVGQRQVVDLVVARLPSHRSAFGVVQHRAAGYPAGPRRAAAPPRAPARGRHARRRAWPASAARRPRPIAGPSRTPAASRSSPSISSRTWRSRSSHSPRLVARVRARRPARPARAGAAAAAAAISDGALRAPAAPRASAGGARRGGEDRVAVGGLERERVEQRAQLRRPARRAGRQRERQPVAAAVGGQQRAALAAPASRRRGPKRRVDRACRAPARAAHRAPRPGPARAPAAAARRRSARR